MLTSLPVWLSLACAPPDTADLEGTEGGRVDVFFNDPGTRRQNMWQPDVLDVMIDMIDAAEATIDFSVMGFSHPDVVNAFVRAHDRGIRVRMVGDAGHLYNTGYHMMDNRRIPMVTGNLNHIMHNKFMIVDDRFVFGGTSNWTPTDLVHNSNNFFIIDSTEVAADFQAEFDQMFGGLFGHNKVEIDNGRVYQIGDTTVEVWFSPNEDAMGRILEYVDAAQESVRFTIFAFTKDQVGSSFIRKQAEFDAKEMEERGLNPDDPADVAALSALPYNQRRTIAGMIDNSQLHSNGQYHEVYRLLGAQIPMRLDSNDNGLQPGDYQAGGGRLHSKTMVIDAFGEEPVVITGSFNWSASATVSNDEYLLIFKGPRVAEQFDDYFELLWADGKQFGATRADGIDLFPGDIVINEVMWYGAHSGNDEGTDEFIELRNLTDQDIKLDMWQITTADDFMVGLPPGSTIKANDTFLIADHVLEAYQDGAPQDEQSAFLTADMVVNAFNDNRQARLYIKDGALELFLRDPDGTIVDRAGDGGAAFAGGPNGNVVRSMERRQTPGDGSLPESWYAFTGTMGMGTVNPDYAAEILASPGVDNSKEP
ncbi:MAG: phospholipase D-like domain-containing protein [Myxococcota bacterium]